MPRLVPLALILASAGPATAQPARAPFVIAETGAGYATIDEAVSAVRMDTATILIAPGVYRQCTVQEGGRITFRAVQPGTAIFDSETCEGKAAFVLRGLEATVDGLVFRGMQVPDGNGAGIRTEMGNLTVRNTMFLDSEVGILGGQPAGQQIVVDRSTFSGLGRCRETQECSHSLYLSNRGSVTVTNSRFERGRGGHYVKLRVPNVSITDNSFDDTGGTRTNYMIDLSEGGTGLIARNTMVQGRAKENWTALIVIAAEARTYPSAGLRIEANSANLAPGDTHRPAFVASYSRDKIALGANRLGPGIRPFETRLAGLRLPGLLPAGLRAAILRVYRG